MDFPTTPWTRLFLSAVLVQTAATVALQAYVFAQFERGVEPTIRQVADGQMTPMYMSLFLFGLAYQLVLALSAVRSNSMIQTVGVCVYNACLLAYSINQSIQFGFQMYALDLSRSRDGQPFLKPGNTVWKDSKPALIVIPCILAIGTCVFCVAGWYLRSEFAWLVYTTIHGDVAMKRRILTMDTFMALLRFGFFFVTGYFIQRIVWSAGPGPVHINLIVAIVLLVIAVVLFISAAVCVRMESRAGTIAVIIGFLAAVGYFSYEVSELAGNPVHVMIAFAVVALVTAGFTAMAGVLCLMNFGQGVRECVGNKRNHSRLGHSRQESDVAIDYHYDSGRMSLD